MADHNSLVIAFVLNQCIPTFTLNEMCLFSSLLGYSNIGIENVSTEHITTKIIRVLRIFDVYSWWDKGMGLVNGPG